MIELRYRSYVLPSTGETYQVPTHVSRVDSKGWAGWQVRFATARQLNRFFSDAQYRKQPSASLHAATKYVLANRPVMQSQVRADAGVNWQWVTDKRGLQQLYAVASSPKRSQSSKRVYAGTVKTTDKARQDAAWMKAQQLRDQMLKAHKKSISLAQSRRN